MEKYKTDQDPEKDNLRTNHINSSHESCKDCIVDVIWFGPEANWEPCQTSKVEQFVEIGIKCSTLDVGQGSEYATDLYDKVVYYWKFRWSSRKTKNNHKITKEKKLVHPDIKNMKIAINILW